MTTCLPSSPHWTSRAGKSGFRHGAGPADCPARNDIAAILAWSVRRFGPSGRQRYEALAATALRDLAANSERIGSVARPELGGQSRIDHLRHSRARARTPEGLVHAPRHIVVYRMSGEGDVVIVLRVLHEAMDIQRQVMESDPGA